MMVFIENVGGQIVLLAAFIILSGGTMTGP